MLKEILPEVILNSINQNLTWDKLYEIRLRCDKPCTINYGGSYYFLGLNGLVKNEDEAIFSTASTLENIVLKASNNSIYAYNNEIKQGFLTLNNGIRIGISGEIVAENNKIKTIKNFSSLNIRISHQIKNCCLKIFDKLFLDNNMLDTLIISVPGAGKTTFLRDIAFQLGKQNYPFNLLIIDERGEIASVCEGKAGLDVGKFTDVISYSTKQYGFEMGIRAMSPNIIFTDEIATEQDANAILYAIGCGVKVIATTHSNGIKELFLKTNFNELLNKKAFKRFVVLSNRNGPGTIEGIYDENFNYLT